MNPGIDVIASGLKMAASLGVALALVLALLYGMRKLARQGVVAGHGSRIEVLENRYVGVKKSIALVRIPGKILVVGLSGERINLLDTLDEESVPPAAGAGTPSAFGPILVERLKRLGSRRRGKEEP